MRFLVRDVYKRQILTGRYAAKSVMEKADLVTGMTEIRHYYKNGVGARRGIEM